MNNRMFFGVLLVAAVILVSWFVLGGKAAVTNSLGKKPVIELTPAPILRGTGGFSYSDSATGTDNGMEKGGVSERVVVTYTDSGFAPAPVTVKAGVTVTFVNESSRGMWVASGVHPTHQLLPGFDQLGSVGKSGVYEYTFTKAGSWNYHNHLRPADSANIIVTN